MTKPPEIVVADIVRDVLSEEPLSVDHIPTLEDSDVFRVHLASGALYFKAEHEGHPIDVAAWAYEKAAAVGVPVPEVVHLDLTCERWPKQFVLITAIEGTDLEHDPLEGAALIGALEGYGELLRRLHTIPTRGFGDLVFRSGEAEPVGSFADHAAHVRASPDWGLGYLVDRGLVPPATAGLVGDVLGRHHELIPAPEQGVLVHDDPGLDHLFVDRRRMQITGLIDFEPRSADPVWDLAAFSFHYPDLASHLIAGYGEVPADLDVRCDVYGLVRAIGSARWDHELGLDVGACLAEVTRRLALLKTRLDG